ncbi:hypothetical protein D7223_15015 [Micromonospora endolithica]|uniref:Putative Flp pilus-assembly TadG-like N-terminal domain-containing protein n=1 Tax=Micromonospora endolithica TaxID=230091 RepID=A0A3A9ZDG4_9ACTN|nr:hypothetical protein D7223_15015 [Micromonospora endolithica]TWJ25044.1 putative Flp pilus-assembly TadE/G-like protein [Micromonospora endolithica]
MIVTAVRDRLRARLGRADADRGGVAVTVGLLIGSGVLLGMMALVVDVGLLYVERGQLQNGADAAAVAAARACALDPAECTGPDGETVDALAGRYADGNANDGQATAEVCGRGGGLATCGDTPVDCLRAAPAAGPYVEVRTGTRRDGDETLLPPVFAQAVLGGYRGAEVRACARATWGGPVRADTLALALPFCDWERLTSSGTVFPAAPGPVPVRPGTTGTCTAAGAGFRWLDADDDCRVVRSVNQETAGATDDPDCGDALEDALGRSVLVPVVDPPTGGGGDAFTVRGFAAFVVTGFTFGDRTEGTGCGDGVEPCVRGHLTEQLLPGGGAIGGPDLGARVVALVG